ncbi:DUF2213 domain-containing protein [Paraburkholderia sp. BR10936]|uniref:DUF2213 domain-containing protein n=1 Tax=Paraburkholderia sp. BR10936 TaxID=3236993 RepID=UPI0034D2B94B
MREFIDVEMSRRVQHPDGFVTVPARVARTGVQFYRAFELDMTDGDPMRVIGVYRPPEEVFAPASMATYSGTPITNEHVGRVTPKNWKEKAVGTVVAPHRDGIYVGADLIFQSQDALDAIDAGKKQLSATYDATLDWTAGTHEGMAYDAVQRDIRINSVALVRAARCGAACSIADAEMPGANAMSTRRIVVDGIPLELDDVAAATVEKLQSQLSQAQATIETQKTALASTVRYGEAQLTVSNPSAIQAVIDDQATRIAQLGKDAMTPEQRDAMVADWVKTLDHAKRLMPKIVTDGKTCAAIRREVVASMYDARKPLIDAVLSGKSLDDADEASIRTAFAVLASSAAEPAPRRSDPVADALTASMRAEDAAAKGGGGGGRDGAREHAVTADGLPDPDAARASWVKRQTTRLVRVAAK